MTDDLDKQKFDEWCILEIMGHNKYAGRVSEQTLGGASFIRIDVPAVGDKAAFSKLFGASSIYAITPVTEDVARLVAAKLRQQPLEVYDLPEAMKVGRMPLLEAKAPDRGYGYRDDEDPNEDFDEDEGDI